MPVTAIGQRYKMCGVYKGNKAAARFLVYERLQANGSSWNPPIKVRGCAYCFDPETGMGGIFAGGVCSAACEESTR